MLTRPRSGSLLQPGLLACRPEPTQGGSKLAQGSFRNRIAQPALQFLVERTTGIGKHPTAFGRELDGR